MRSMQFHILPVPEILKNDVESFRIFEYTGEEGLAIPVSPEGVPGIVFQQNNGRSALENIITHSGRTSCPPPLFLYGPGTEPGVMNYKRGSFTTTQVIFKPHALKTLLGINASRLTAGWTDLHEFWPEDLTNQLLEARNEQERTTFLINFLVARLKQAKTRDTLVEESLRYIHANIDAIHVKDVLDYLHLSERQFERRFTQTVGLSPHLYIRVKRFNEALRLMQTGQFARLTDVASALNFYDQSHFIRDIKAFSGMTPTSLFQKVDDFQHDQPEHSSV
ncbi:MAG TPA: AraC family transcriptional regulator [Ktedonosporobacter sp.]|nr:AraC family transcriptional regulator [Ktedonosporobacter sp.]